MSEELESRLRAVERTAAQADTIHANFDQAISEIRSEFRGFGVKMDTLQENQSKILVNIAKMDMGLLALQKALDGGVVTLSSHADHKRQIEVLQANIKTVSENQAKASGARRLIIDSAVVLITVLGTIELALKVFKH